ncbi:MAG: large conductance mechanosensitive channel protein MscL [Acidobacteriota bacterium]
MIQGFKNFIARGNVIDLAVGVIIGAAFGEIVNSLTKDILTPVIGMLGGQPDFSALKVGGITIGNFINTIVSFLIKALGMYVLIVLPFNRYAAKMTPPPTPTEALLGEIRDLIKARGEQAKGAGA